MKNVLFIFAVFGSTVFIEAQDSVRNTGNLYIHSGAQVNGFGCFVNAAGSQFVNAGNLYLQRNLINDEVLMAPGAGTLYFNGSLQQVIGGSQPFNTYHLTTNNPAGILLNNDLSIAGTHTFSSGLITVSSTPNYLVYESGATYTGDNDTRHVNGWVKKNGSDDFSFPVGDGVYERKVALSTLSASSAFTCHYYKPTFSIFNLMSPLVQVKENEYWQINKLSGGTARITLNWDHSRVPMNHVLVSEILVAYFNTTYWNSLGGTAAGNVLTTGQITSAPVTNFGSHTFGYTNFPLPLTLTSFTGIRQNAVSKLEWLTENEAGIDHFVVERSFDGVNYSTVGQLKARNSGNREKYTLSDNSSFNGQAFYRLRIVERDGRLSYSGVVVLNDINESDGLTIINPVHSQIQMQNKSGKNQNYAFSIFSLSGQSLQTGFVSMAGFGGGVIPLTQHYTRGIYQLELKSKNETILRKIFIY